MYFFTSGILGEIWNLQNISTLIKTRKHKHETFSYMSSPAYVDLSFGLLNKLYWPGSYINNAKP